MRAILLVLGLSACAPDPEIVVASLTTAGDTGFRFAAPEGSDGVLVMASAASETDLGETSTPGPMAPAGDLAALDPAKPYPLGEDITVDIVLVGVEPADHLSGVPADPLGFDERFAAFLLPRETRTAIMLQHTRPRVVDNRLPASLRLRYRFVYAGPAFTAALGDHVFAIAEPRPPTLAQLVYNQQPARARTLVGHHVVEGPRVEEWLAANLGALDGRDRAGQPVAVDLANPTMFVLDLHRHPAFVPHAFVDRREASPDTGFVPGELEWHQSMATGGRVPGTRMFVLDVSAGPVWHDGSFLVTVRDHDGDGALDHDLDGRPGNDAHPVPIWEYASPRPLPTPSLFTMRHTPADLMREAKYGELPKRFTLDLLTYVRFVMVDGLVAASPWADPMGAVLPYSPRARGGRYLPATEADLAPLAIDVTEAHDASGPVVDLDALFDEDVVTAGVAQLFPWRKVSVRRERRAFDGTLAEVFACVVGWYADGPSCYGERLPIWRDGALTGWSQLDMTHWAYDHRMSITSQPASVPVLLFNLADARALPPWLGSAEPDLRGLRVSHISQWITPTWQAGARDGATSTLMHEVGHGLGLSHPFQIYDGTLDMVTQPTGPYFFLWLADGQATVMGYLRRSNRFGPFDVVNHRRALTIRLIEHTRFLAARALAGSEAEAARPELAAADRLVIEAAADLDSEGAATAARAAYLRALAAVRIAKATIGRRDWPGYHFVDRDFYVDHFEERPR